jgi:hypothetical protein
MGNLHLMTMVSDNLDRYNACTTDPLEKRDITTEIVNRVLKEAGRFVTQESGVCIEASNDVAHQKVSILVGCRVGETTVVCFCCCCCYR